MNRGTAYGQQGDYARAIKDLNKAIEINPMWNQNKEEIRESFTSNIRRNDKNCWEGKEAVHSIDKSKNILINTQKNLKKLSWNKKIRTGIKWTVRKRKKGIIFIKKKNRVEINNGKIKIWINVKSILESWGKKKRKRGNEKNGRQKIILKITILWKDKIKL